MFDKLVKEFRLLNKSVKALNKSNDDLTSTINDDDGDDDDDDEEEEEDVPLYLTFYLPYVIQMWSPIEVDFAIIF